MILLATVNWFTTLVLPKPSVPTAISSSSLTGGRGERSCKEEQVKDETVVLQQSKQSDRVSCPGSCSPRNHTVEGLILGKALRKLSLNMSFYNPSYFILRLFKAINIYTHVYIHTHIYTYTPLNKSFHIHHFPWKLYWCHHDLRDTLPKSLISKQLNLINGLSK